MWKCLKHHEATINTKFWDICACYFWYITEDKFLYNHQLSQGKPFKMQYIHIYITSLAISNKISTHTQINILNKGSILLAKHRKESEVAAFACLLFHSPLACIVGLPALLLSCCLCVRIFLLIRTRTTVGTREIFKVSMTLPVLDIGKDFMLVTEHHYIVNGITSDA